MTIINIQNKIFIVLLTLCVTLSSGYALSTVNLNYYYVEFILFYIFLYKIILYFNVKKIDFFIYSFLSLILMISIPFIIHGAENFTVYSSYLFKIVIAFGIVISFEFSDFSLYFRKLMLIISLISLLGYYLLNVENSAFLTSLPEYINLNDAIYKSAYVYFYIPWISERNMGIFWEPGLFATFLILSLIFEIFSDKKKSKFRVLVYCVTLITTTSSAGYLLLFILFFMWIIKFLTEKSFEFKKYFTPLILTLSIIILLNYQKIIYGLNLQNNKIFSKLVGENLVEQTRVSAPKFNIQMFAENPLFGNSLNFITENISFVADTSTNTFALSMFGVLGIQYSLFWIYGLFREKSIFNIDVLSLKILMLLMFLIILNKEPHLGNLFTWCILFYMLKPDNQKIKYKEKKINE